MMAESQKNLEMLEKFFKYNLEIKDILIRISPDNKYNYNESSRIEYGDKLYFYLNDLKDLFLMICESLGSDDLKKTIDVIFKKYQKDLFACGYDYNKLKTFYENNLSSMKPEFVEKTKLEFQGHSLFGCSVHRVIGDVKTVNELLHAFHASVINDENTFYKMPKLTENSDELKTITLYGEEMPLSTAILKNFPMDMHIGNTDIISLPKSNKILIMCRDKGHALSIEVDIEDDKSMIRYFIPKVCNPVIVNELKGINKIKSDAQFANGRFEIDTKDLLMELFDFIAKVPTDKEMFTYGGWAYQDEHDINITRN